MGKPDAGVDLGAGAREGGGVAGEIVVVRLSSTIRVGSSGTVGGGGTGTVPGGRMILTPCGPSGSGSPSVSAPSVTTVVVVRVTTRRVGSLADAPVPGGAAASSSTAVRRPTMRAVPSPVA